MKAFFLLMLALKQIIIVFINDIFIIGAYITLYSSCIPKGRVHMPFSLREMIEKVKYSKVKLYKGVDVDLKVRYQSRSNET